VMETFPEVASWYQIELTTRNSLDYVTLKVEVNPDFDFDEVAEIEALQKRMRRKLKDALMIQVDVQLVEPKTIPRSEGKAKRVIDLRTGIRD